MILKIKEFILLIFLVLLQSCSGGKVGSFLETSFEDLGNSIKIEESKDESQNKQILNSVKKENNQKISQEAKNLENTKNKIKNKQVILSVEKENNQKISEEAKNLENTKNKIKNKQVINSEKILDNVRKKNKNSKSSQKRDSDLQSYKIIFILKNVDPKDPIEQFSTILRNSEVNFEIEKIERFFDSKNNNIKRN